MKITTIQISGFRKILKATINMEDDITVIAGANNSGKTSIVELFNYVFNAKGALCSDDFPVYESQEWCTAVFPYFQAQFKQENKKDDLIANILGTIVPSENPENEMLLTPIEVLIQVDYDPAGDDIRNFADYIMELDPDNSSFYFIYRFELDKDLLRKSLDSEYEKLCNRFDKLVGDDDKDAEGIRIIKEMLIQIYTDSCKDAAYFSDKTYSNIVPMDVASFRGLFNYQNIMAGRTLYEGDTERMLIKNVLLSDRFETLRNQYISFVQVGGAYAIKYKPILEYLNVKSLIITDLDYKTEAKTEADVRQSSSTNATINTFAAEALSDAAPTVETLYSWKDSSGCIVSNNICLEFQGQTDGYARTLEEAMLAKRYNVSALDTKTKEEWTILRKNDKLMFVIPQKADSCSIRAIVQHTSKNKTDFMYSVILNKLVDTMLPNYIEEGLMWLTN